MSSEERANDEPSHKKDIEMQDVMTLYTSKGMPYKMDPSEENLAKVEHTREKLPLCIPIREIEARYGSGNRLYFSFTRFIIFTNFLLAIVGFVSWIPHVMNIEGGVTNITYDDLFVAKYTPEDYSRWLITSCIAWCLMVVFGSSYFVWARCIFSRGLKKRANHDNLFSQSGHVSDVIKENAHITKESRTKRVIGSAFIFIFILAVSVGIVVGLLQIEKVILLNIDNVSDSIILPVDVSLNRHTVMDIVISMMVSIFQFVWQKVCGALTKFEKLRTWSGYRISHTLKLITFKVLNVAAYYIAVDLVFFNSACVAGSIGSKLLTLILSDIIVWNFIELVLPLLTRCCKTKCVGCPCCKNNKGDEESRPEFDISEEYLEVVYRQFIVYIGIFVCPVLGLLVCFSNGLEYGLDKFRMLRICKKPKYVEHSYATFLLFFLFLVAVLASFVWPYPLHF